MRRRALGPAGLLLLAACGKGPEESGSEAPRAAPPAAPAATAVPPEYRVTGKPADGGSIRGIVTLTGPVPELQARPVTKDHEACGHKDLPNPSLVLSTDKGVADAVIRLEGLGGGKPFPEVSAVLDQKGCVFRPHTQVVPKGATLAILNSDAVGHNVHAYDGSNETIFNLGTALKGVRVEQKMTYPGLLRLKCDIHPWMLGWIWVAETPYVAVSDAEGRYVLGDVPPGTYQLVAWHELLGEKRVPVTVAAKGEAAVDLTLSLVTP